MGYERKFSTELVQRVFDDHEGTWIEVGEWPEVPGFVELRTTGDKNVQFYGEMNLSLDPNQAIALGNALIALGNKVKADNDKAKR